MASPPGAFFIRIAPSALLLRRSKPVPAEPGAASCERPKHAANWSNIRWNSAITDQPAISELNITNRPSGSAGTASPARMVKEQRRLGVRSCRERARMQGIAGRDQTKSAYAALGAILGNSVAKSRSHVAITILFAGSNLNLGPERYRQQ
jgi:hypothetical protein